MGVSLRPFGPTHSRLAAYRNATVSATLEPLCKRVETGHLVNDKGRSCGERKMLSVQIVIRATAAVTIGLTVIMLAMHNRPLKS